MRTKIVASCLALVAVAAVFAEKVPPLPAGAFTYAAIPDTQSYDGEGCTKVQQHEDLAPEEKSCF